MLALGVNFKCQVERAGIVPFTLYRTSNEGTINESRSTLSINETCSTLSIKFLLGVDRKTQELTNLGGRQEEGENGLDTALREFHEESREIFQDVCPGTTHLEGRLCWMDSRRTELMIFLPLSNDVFESAVSKFEETRLYIPNRAKRREYRHCQDEISCLVVLDEKAMNNLIQGGSVRGKKLWSRVRNFLRNPLFDMLTESIKCVENVSSETIGSTSTTG